MTYLSDIDALVESLPFGEVQLTVKRHNGKTTQIGLNKFEKRKYASNQAAVTDLLTEIKMMTDAGQSGSLSFTLMLKGGKIDTVIHQGHESKDYK